MPRRPLTWIDHLGPCRHAASGYILLIPPSPAAWRRSSAARGATSFHPMVRCSASLLTARPLVGGLTFPGVDPGLGPIAEIVTEPGLANQNMNVSDPGVRQKSFAPRLNAATASIALPPGGWCCLQAFVKPLTAPVVAVLAGDARSNRPPCSIIPLYAVLRPLTRRCRPQECWDRLGWVHRALSPLPKADVVARQCG